MTRAANQAGDSASSRTPPGLNSGAQESINDHGVRYYLYHNESVSVIQYLILAVKSSKRGWVPIISKRNG